MTLSEAFWTVFEMSGSVVAYLLYCHYHKVEVEIRSSMLQ